MKFLLLSLLIAIVSGVAGALMETVFHVTNYQAYFWLGYLTGCMIMALPCFVGD